MTDLTTVNNKSTSVTEFQSSAVNDITRTPTQPTSITEIEVQLLLAV